MNDATSIIEITDHSFAYWNPLSQAPALLAFCETDCPASQTLLVMLTNAAKRCRGPAIFAITSLSKAPGLAARFGVASAPTLLLLRDGVVCFQFAGELSPHELDDLLANAVRGNSQTVSEPARFNPCL